MYRSRDTQVTAFSGGRRLVSGKLEKVVLEVKALLDEGQHLDVVLFHDGTGELVEIDFRGDAREVLARLPQAQRGESVPVAPPDPKPRRSGPGRPRLGVVGREVTLLPRQWEWLNRQPGGASATLRRLVDRERKDGKAREARRESQNAAFRFMSAIAGDRPGYEEAIRALFAGDPAAFDAQTVSWPSDVRAYAKQLASPALSPEPVR